MVLVALALIAILAVEACWASLIGVGLVQEFAAVAAEAVERAVLAVAAVEPLPQPLVVSWPLDLALAAL